MCEGGGGNPFSWGTAITPGNTQLGVADRARVRGAYRVRLAHRAALLERLDFDAGHGHAHEGDLLRPRIIKDGARCALRRALCRLASSLRRGLFLLTLPGQTLARALLLTLARHTVGGAAMRSMCVAQCRSERGNRLRLVELWEQRTVGRREFEHTILQLGKRRCAAASARKLAVARAQLRHRRVAHAGIPKEWLLNLSYHTLVIGHVACVIFQVARFSVGHDSIQIELTRRRHE